MGKLSSRIENTADTVMQHFITVK